MKVDIFESEIKAQPIRLMDILLLAPVLIYAGTRKQKLSPRVSQFLFISGIGIFTYELKNYLAIKARSKNVEPQ